MGKKPVVGVVAAIVLLVALVLIARQLGIGSGIGGGPEDVFWYDLDKGDLFAHPATIEPVTAPSGGEGVRAHVFACTSCDDQDDRFTAYLERYTDEARRILKEEQARNNPMARPMAMAHVLVRRPNDDQWVAATGPQGMQIMQERNSKCGGKPAKPCSFRK